MERKSQEYLEDNFIDQTAAKACGFDDDQLAEELDAALAAGDPLPKAPGGELEKIMGMLEGEKLKSPSHHKPKHIRRMVKTLVAAAVLGAMVIGGSMWVGAKRYYTYDSRERADLSNVVVLNNSEDNLVKDGSIEVKEAYEQIQHALNIKTLELSYLPDRLIFSEYEIRNRKGLIKFRAGDEKLFFYQGISDRPSSLGFVSDMKELQKIYNEYLDMEIAIYEQDMADGEKEYSMIIDEGNTYYILEGIMEEEEFIKIVGGIKFFDN